MHIYTCYIPKVKHTHHETASASSHLTALGTTKRLQQPTTSAIMSSSLKAKDSNKPSDLNGMTKHVLCILHHNKTNNTQ